jgi:hypothetical protein
METRFAAFNFYCRVPCSISEHFQFPLIFQNFSWGFCHDHHTGPWHCNLKVLRYYRQCDGSHMINGLRTWHQFSSEALLLQNQIFNGQILPVWFKKLAHNFFIHLLKSNLLDYVHNGFELFTASSYSFSYMPCTQHRLSSSWTSRLIPTATLMLSQATIL